MQRNNQTVLAESPAHQEPTNEADALECGDTSPLLNEATCRLVPKRGHVRALQGIATLRVLALAIFLGVAFVANADVKVGDAFPQLASYKLEGKLPEDLKDKVVLVDFWASWCGPCAESFPAMDELQKKYGPRGLVIIAVNVDEKKKDMDDFLKEHPVSFIVVRDGKQKLVEKTGIATMPSSFLLDARGKVVFAHSGFKGNETKKQYEQEIESLLNQK